MKLFQALFYLCFFIAATLFFLPKKNLYYFAEHQLLKHRIIIGDERINKHPFSIEIEDANIYVEGIKAAKIIDTSISLYLLHNVLEAKNIRLSGIAKDFLPTRIDSLRASYDLWNPTKIVFAAEGEFGKVRGSFHLQTHTLSLILQPSHIMETKYRQLLRRMKKQKEGGYSYEQNL